MSDVLASAETAEDIFAADDIEILAIPVPKWKRTVHIRQLSAAEGIELSKKLTALPEGQKTEAMRLVLGACLCTTAGAPLLTTDEQRAKLYDRSAAVLADLQDAAMKLQGWQNESAAKNVSGGTAPAVSPTV